MRKKRPFERTANMVRDTSLVVIASEDTCAVDQYFKKFESSRIIFRVLETKDGKSDPRYVLNRLKDYLSEYEIAERDQLWLVCDTDHWIDYKNIKKTSQVVRECKKNNIEVAFSNPCFELWLLLHFDEFPLEESLDCNAVAEKLKSAAGSYDKSRIDKLRITNNMVEEAVRRASENYKPAQLLPRKPHTAVHRIVEEMISRRIISITEDE